MLVVLLFVYFPDDDKCRLIANIITLITCAGTWVMAYIMQYNSSYDRKMSIVRTEYTDFKRSIENVTYRKNRRGNAIKGIVGDFKENLGSVNHIETAEEMLKTEMDVYRNLRRKSHLYPYTNRLTNLLILIGDINNREIEEHFAGCLRDYMTGTEKYILYLECLCSRDKKFQDEERLRLKRLVEKYHLLSRSNDFPPSKELHQKELRSGKNDSPMFFSEVAFQY